MQTCRKAYIVTEKETGNELEIDNEYIMSPKDLLTVNFMDKILDAGVKVLKIEGKSMGCIACEVFKAKPAKLGIINNISKGGLTFQHVDSNIQISNEFVLDILLTDCRFYLPGIPFTLITDFAIPEDFVFSDEEKSEDEK